MKPLEADSMPSAMLKSKMRSSAHSVKQWQLASIGFNPPVDEKALVTTETKFSTWTPVINKTSNQQLFQERNNLILHWFDLWTDKQRKQFIHNVLMRCSRSQLKFTRDWFEEVVPVTKLDFTTVLPRILSLYILSFLSPQELCMAAQVNWHWKFLAEQDCLWIPKCVKRGWFLPYSPADNEYGSWKRHYVACAKDLDYLTPREAADMYGTLNEPKTDTEDQEERLRERLIRKRIWEKVAEHKKASLTSRPPWLSNSWTLGSLKSKGHNEKLRASLGQQGLTAALVLIGNQTRSQHSLSQLLRQDTQSHLTQDTALERKMMTMSMQSLPKQMNLSSGSSNSVSFPKASPSQSSPRLLLVSSRIPGYEMLLCSAWVDVIPVLYDYYGTTLEALLYRVEQVLHGQRACSVGVFTEGHPGEIALLKGCTVSQRTVLHPEVRQFWENLSGFVVSRTDGGSLDIFFPLAVSETGMELISNISVLTGLDVSAPTGVGTGSHQHILSEWLGRAVSPSATYFSAPALLCWCRQAERLEEVLLDLRKQMGPQLGDLRTEVCGRVLGQFLFDSVGLSEIHTNVEIARAVAEGLAALSKENCENPLEFLSDFLRRGVSHTSQTATAFLTECVPKGAPLEPPETATLPVGSVDRRTMFARELFHSEKRYVQLLDAVRLVYVTPLRAALSSNRAILSSANVLIIFSDILDVAELNRQFLDELAERIQEWGPSQCIGDVCVKFSTRLRAYTNFFNNYTTILRTIDKCREMVPAFRAFLKRHDKTMATEIMSLQDLLLLPPQRFEEYVTLLQALSLHTAPEHPDRAHLRTALDTLTRYRDFVQQLKQTTDGDSKMLETQKMIQSCPNLLEANRYLIRVEDVAQLSCSDKEISAALRIYEHVGELTLFLFNDALVLCNRTVSQVPFERRCRTTRCFLASVALHRLSVHGIADTRYIKNAFGLRGPRRQWVCAAETNEDKFTLLSALQSAINAAIGDK